MRNVLVSIITTVKNGEKHILETLENIQRQTFCQFEHIVIDDGSTDNTVHIVENFKRNNPEYPVRIHSFSVGRGRALNYAVEKSKAEWIAIIDADDIWHPQKLEIQYDLIKNSDFDVLATESELCVDNFDKVKFDFITEERREIELFSAKELLLSNKINHSSVIIKKSICKYDENRNSQFDYELWLRLLREHKRVGKVTHVLSYRRIHKEQSFEGKMKKLYRLRSFKLKARESIYHRDITSLFINTIKLLFDMVLPRTLRFKLREKVKKKH